MKLQIETNSYNEKRHGKPWIANVYLKEDDTLGFKFGNWIGDAGYAGILILDIEPDMIFAMGQKDNRNAKYTECNYYLTKLNSEGALSWEYISKVDAWKLLAIRKVPT